MIEDKNLPVLPDGWAWVKLEDISSKLQAGGTPLTSKHEYYENGTIPFVKTEDIVNSNKFLTETKTKITEKGLNNCSAWIVPENSILYSMYASYGEPIINKIKAATSQAIITYIPPDDLIDINYLYYYFKKIKPEVKTRGTTQKNLNAKIVRNLNVPLPSLEEQKRIVKKIEELFTKQDAGVQQLHNIKAQLKVYRQAVLEWAFGGLFGYAQRPSKHVKDGELLEGWKWKKLKEITSVLGDGLHGTPNYSDDGDYYFINGNNLSNGKIEIKDNTKRVSLAEFEKYKKPLNERTIFVSINGTIGNTAFYDNEKVILGKSACYFNVKDFIDKHYIRYYITSLRFVNYANENATGSTIKNVGLKAMRDFEIPIPPLLEQHKIVEEIERRFSTTDNVTNTVNQGLEQSERLRQSILKRAFQGKLVPQDPADEPAEVMLKRIKNESEEYEQMRLT